MSYNQQYNENSRPHKIAVTDDNNFFVATENSTNVIILDYQKSFTIKGRKSWFIKFSKVNFARGSN